MYSSNLYIDGFDEHFISGVFEDVVCSETHYTSDFKERMSTLIDTSNLTPCWTFRYTS